MEESFDKGETNKSLGEASETGAGFLMVAPTLIPMPLQRQQAPVLEHRQESCLLARALRS